MEQLIQVVISDYEQEGSNSNGQVGKLIAYQCQLTQSMHLNIFVYLK